MHFSPLKLCRRDEQALLNFSLMFPAISTHRSVSNISPTDASMTLEGMPPLNNVEINADTVSDIVAQSNEILTAFASFDTEVEDITKSDGTLLLEFQCRYHRGKCLQPRTLKKNESMHSYCEYHRQLSVHNQRTFDPKKRRQRRELEAKEAEKRLCRSRQPTSHSCVRNAEM